MNTNGNKPAREREPSTPEYRLRTNRIHSKLKTLCHQWMVKHRPEVVERMRRLAKKEEAR